MVAVLKLGANLIGLIYVYYKRYVGVCFKKRWGILRLLFLPYPPLPTYPLPRFVAYKRKFIFFCTQMSLTRKEKQVIKYMPLFVTRVTKIIISQC